MSQHGRADAGTGEAAERFRTQILQWAAQELRDFPWRRTTDPYAVFVAEYLLQQTDAPRVLPVYDRLLRAYPTLQDLASASTAKLRELLRPLGFTFRAERLHAAAVQLMASEHTPGRIPDNEEDLMTLPGIGRYTARAVCAQAYGGELAVLDTNVVRILQRYFGLEANRARPRNDPALWAAAQAAAPPTRVARWNLALIDFGSAVCKHRRPLCNECPLRGDCCFWVKYHKPAAPLPLENSGEETSAPGGEASSAMSDGRTSVVRAK